MKIKPCEGRTVHGPDGVTVPDGGADVKDTSYWRRRIRDGDVKKVNSLSKTKPASKCENKGEKK